MYLPKRSRLTQRESISAEIRNSFKMYTNLYSPICPVCLETITSSEHMEIGHIVSCFHGGNSDIENLIAIHRQCNRGTDDLTILIDTAPLEKKEKFLRFCKS